MRVLVTGAAGFIGSHAVEEFKTAGHEVSGVDRRDGDLTNAGEASYLIQRSAPDLVLHLAAQVGRQFGEADRGFTIHSNAVVTAHVAHEAQAVGARLVLASSSEIYGDMGSADVFEESIPALPYNLYGLTKRWSEEVAQLYCRDVAIVRLAMPYGPGLPPGKGRAAIVNFLAAAHRGETISVHRNSERCWCWVKDTVRGIRLVAESKLVGPFNVGRDDDCASMLNVARLAQKVTGNYAGQIEEVDAPGNQVLVKRLRINRLRRLGWEPTLNLEEGMRLTYEAMLELGQL